VNTINAINTDSAKMIDELFHRLADVLHVVDNCYLFVAG